MTADEIRKRLKGAGLKPHHAWTTPEGVLTLEVSGSPDEWQKALGPTRGKVRAAIFDEARAYFEGLGAILPATLADECASRVVARLFP